MTRRSRASSPTSRLFTFMMLMLVTADNLVQLFFGWEGVGLASYLLIGYWYEKESANAAAMKAFIVNRVGDLFFMLGLALTFWTFGSRSSSTRSSPASRSAAGCDLPRPAGAGGDRRAAVPRRLRQVGAARPAHLAAGRDGRPDAGLRADPCGDHGDRGRLPGGAHVAGDRIRADRARHRHRRRRLHRDLRRDHRLRAERHQADHRLLDLLAARLHVLRRRRRRLPGGDLPPLHPRLLQGAAVPRRGLASSTPCRTSRTSAGWAASGRRSRSPTR